MKIFNLTFLTAGTLLLSACARGPAPARTVAARATPSSVSSNLLRTDYAGSAACQSCHPKVYEAAGINHMNWISRLEHRGQDLYPRLRDTIRDHGIFDPPGGPLGHLVERSRKSS